VFCFHPLQTLRARKVAGAVLLPSFGKAAILGLYSGVFTSAFSESIKGAIRFLLIERMRRVLKRLEDTLLLRSRRCGKGGGRGPTAPRAQTDLYLEDASTSLHARRKVQEVPPRKNSESETTCPEDSEESDAVSVMSADNDIADNSIKAEGDAGKVKPPRNMTTPRRLRSQTAAA